MRTVISKADPQSRRIAGRIKLISLGTTASRTHFGIEAQRDHVKGSLLDALRAHGLDPVTLDLPHDATFQLGETGRSSGSRQHGDDLRG